MNILVTGGTGFIGSLTSLRLIEAGHRPVLLDNLCNSSATVLARIATLSGTRPAFIQGDVRDRPLLDRVLREEKIEAVIHFAALKAVGESVAQPLAYYDNNVGGTLVLLAAMQAADVRSLVFSSSATVYGAAQQMPLREDAPLSATSPYGQSKLMIEQMLADLAAADPRCSFTSLRYFNPVGAHESGLIGEAPQGIPNNLMPYIAQVAVGRRAALRVFGNTYPTPDGTGVRDYIHVLDLADGHLAALQYGHGRPGLHVFNLGSGRGHSVLEVLGAFSRACGRDLPCEICPPRPGDVASSWADPARAQAVLGWHARRGLDQMCADTWRWQSTHPQGYDA